MHHTTPLQSQKPSILGPHNANLSVASSPVGACSTFYICMHFQEGEEKQEQQPSSGSKDMDVQGTFFRAPIKYEIVESV